MTKVYSSTKLKDFVGVENEMPHSDFIKIKLSDWNAHLFFIDNRKCLVFVNILTYYSVFIVDILKRDLKNIDEIFIKRLQEQLMYDRVTDDLEKTVLITGGERICFCNTNKNKKIIGRMNDYVRVFKAHCDIKYGCLKDMDLVYENGLLNNTPTGHYLETKKTWTSPIENLKEKLST